jgi:hypothetical protein
MAKLNAVTARPELERALASGLVAHVYEGRLKGGKTAEPIGNARSMDALLRLIETTRRGVIGCLGDSRTPIEAYSNVPRRLIEFSRIGSRIEFRYGAEIDF